jgi:adenylate kinase family enzyme
MASGIRHRIDRRIAVIGNAGGGKSTLARQIAGSIGVPYIEIDSLLWRQNWEPVDPESYASAHQHAIAADRWVIDGLGRLDSIPARLSRSTEIILVDLPLWVHFWLAAERQIAWSKGPIDNPPGRIASAPPTEVLFRTIWEVDRTWMPDLRQRVDEAEAAGKRTTRISTLKQLDALTKQFGPPRS